MSNVNRRDLVRELEGGGDGVTARSLAGGWPAVQQGRGKAGGVVKSRERSPARTGLCVSRRIFFAIMRVSGRSGAGLGGADPRLAGGP